MLRSENKGPELPYQAAYRLSTGIVSVNFFVPSFKRSLLTTGEIVINITLHLS